MYRSMNIRSLALAVSTLVLSTTVNAAVVTQGALSTNNDGSTNIITDTLNNLEWLRFDVLPQQTYTETVAALSTQDGGGWNIAGTVQAHLFVDALLFNAADTCNPSISISTLCGTTSSWSDGNLGDDYTSTWDYAFFLRTDGKAGYISVDQTGSVHVDPLFNTTEYTDYYAGDNPESITWLLYRGDVSAVPVPAAAWLFGSGLLGLIGVARRKKS